MLMIIKRETVIPELEEQGNLIKVEIKGPEEKVTIVDESLHEVVREMWGLIEGEIEFNGVLVQYRMEDIESEEDTWKFVFECR